jgi:hypothetical protein
MWYDVRFGHHVILGDSQFLRGLSQFSSDRISADDVIDLMTNRGALAVIARELAEQGGSSQWQVRTAIKHMMKAIIGYGDALLWSRNNYHWSYREKARRMARSSHVGPDYRSLYAKAIEFRHLPSYRLLEAGWQRWVSDTCRSLEHAHRRFAKELLGSNVEWSNYPQRLLSDCARRRTVRGWIGVAAERVKDARRRSVPNNWLARLSPARQRIATLLPAACYGDSSPSTRKEFIRAWSGTCDVNFPTRLRKHLDLEVTR